MSFFRLLAAPFAALLLAAPPLHAGTVVEYYHEVLDHYFVTGLPAEIQALDSRQVSGWARTGLSFETFAAADSRLAGSQPVCRFLGNPARGLTSHFYSAFVDECTTVKSRWPDEWKLETDELFRVHLVNPTTGQCPAGTKPVYRLWNKRADANHRYTTDPTIVDAMLVKGYVMEGTGNPARPVAFCSADVAPAQPAAGAPACTIASGAAFPLVGTPVTLTATCTNSPTTFAWSSCTPSGNTCVATATGVGRTAYALVATNAAGASAQARIELDWQLAASGVPSCSVVASSATPQLGTTLTLSANCSHAPTQFRWMACSALLIEVCNVLSECPASAGTCRPVATQAGSVYYALVASNNAGAGPKVGIGVEWLGTGTNNPPPPSSNLPACSISASSTTPAINTTLTLTANCSNSPTSFAWTGCSSTGPTCTTTESTAIGRTYSVAGRNASGEGSPAQISVAWQQPPTAPPACTLTADNPAPYAGGTVTLTASCTQSPTSFQWTNCPSSGSTCTATSATTGPVTYSVTATNALGTSPQASTTLTWENPPPAGADFCGSYNDVMRITLPWGGTLNTSEYGGIRPGTVVVLKLVVPANASSAQRQGQVRFVEFIDGPAERQLTVSASACDFRGFVAGSASRTDPTSATAPMAWSNSQTPSLNFDVATGSSQVRLLPGQTYYFSMRNVNWASGAGSCGTATCNGRFQVTSPN